MHTAFSALGTSGQEPEYKETLILVHIDRAFTLYRAQGRFELLRKRAHRIFVVGAANKENYRLMCRIIDEAQASADRCIAQGQGDGGAAEGVCVYECVHVCVCACNAYLLF